MIIIFDLDGTLCNIEHRLHFIKIDKKYRNWPAFFKACKDDEPIRQTIKILQSLYRGHTIFLWTGRSSTVISETMDWLAEHEVYHHQLKMRPIDDYRKDWELKAEWIDELLKKEKPENIIVFEDRARLVTMYRDRNIICYHVDYGDF